MFTLKYPVHQLFELIKKDILKFAETTFPSEFSFFHSYLSLSLKYLKRDMQCWIPMLQHGLMEEEDIYSLIIENKHRYGFDLPNCKPIDPLTIEEFETGACHLIHSGILNSYRQIPKGTNVLSLIYSFCISKNKWLRAKEKSRPSLGLFY